MARYLTFAISSEMDLTILTSAELNACTIEYNTVQYR